MIPNLAPLEGDILPPGTGTVDVVGSPHPFRMNAVSREVPAGLTIVEMLDRVFPDRGRQNVHVHLVRDERFFFIPQDRWHRVRPRPGTTLAFEIVPRKGDNLLRNILLVTVAVAAIAATLFAGPAVAGMLGSIGLTVSAATAAALASTAITVGGTLLVNTLVPFRPPKLAPLSEGDQSARTTAQSITGAQNQAKPYGAIPVIFGKHRMWALYGAKPFTQLIGDDQWLNLLFVWCYGPVDITDYKIGETPLTSFAPDYEIEERYGLPGDAPITIFPQRQPDEQQFTIELKSADDWHTRTTGLDVDEISVDVTAGNGVYIVDDQGNQGVYTVEVEAQYRLLPGGGFVNMPKMIFTRSTSTIRLGSRVRAPVRGQYEVRVRKASADANSAKIADSVMWTALRTFTNGAPITFNKPLAMTALRIKATGQLNGIIDSFNAVVTSKMTAFNGSVWQAQKATRNPADHIRCILQGPANIRPRPDSELDLPNIQAFWSWCVVNGFRCDMVVEERSTVYDTLADVAACGRGRPTLRDGKWGIIWDDPNAPIVQLFTPRNSWGFSSTRQYRHLPHAWRIRFLNELKGWQQDERIVYRDGFSAANATLHESIELNGQTHPDLVWRHGRYHLADLLLRPERYQLNLGVEHLRCTAGDRVKIQHDVPEIGQASGRVKSVVDDTVTIDEVVIMEASKGYGVTFRQSDGTLIFRRVHTVPGETSQLVLSDTTPGPVPNVDALLSFGEWDGTAHDTGVFRVLTIEQQDNFSARLTFVDDAPEIINADSGTIPEFESNISEPPDPLQVQPTDLRYQELIEGAGRSARAAVVLTWQVPRVGDTRRFEIEIKDVSAGGPWRRYAGSLVPEIKILGLEPGVYSFRIKSLFNDGSSSAWVTLNNVQVLGLAGRPPNVTDFRIAILGNIATLTWASVNAANLSHYEIRHSPSLLGTWGASTLLVENAVGNTAAAPVLAGTYMIKAVTWQGVYSETAAVIISGVDGSANRNVVEVITIDPDFVGTHEDTYVVDGALRLRTTATLDTWGNLDDVNSLLFGSGDSASVVPEGTFTFADTFDLGDVYTSRVSMAMEASDIVLGLDLFNAADLFDMEDLFGDSGPEDWKVETFVRTTEDDPAGTPMWSDWRPLTGSEYIARAFQFQVKLYSFRADVTPAVTKLAITVDMEDRIEAASDVVAPETGLTVTFSPPFRELRSFTPLIQSGNTGDYWQITSKSESGATVQFFDANNVPVTRLVDWTAIGYGKQAA